MFISYDKNKVIKAVSPTQIQVGGQITIKTDENLDFNKLVGRRIVLGKREEGLRVAVICNWGDRCGIATYTELLANQLRSKVEALKVFAEYIDENRPDRDQKDNVVRCWKRGESMVSAVRQILAWKPDVVLIEHEFGIFPKATHFLKMLEMLYNTPYAITLHSVYEHLDKTICTAYIKNMIVHSELAKESLYRNGHLNDVHVIYHGCVEYKDKGELWNIFQEPYVICAHGFGFSYKGVDVAIEAIAHLKKTQDKFKDIFYCYLCSESPHTKTIQQEYYNHLSNKVSELGLEDNVTIMRGYLSEQHICNFMRTAKLAVFSYKTDGDNIVYGASGAIRNAIACGIPTIASDHPHFSEFEGVIPRPTNAIELAAEIDKVFSDEQYRQDMVKHGLDFIRDNNWDVTADKHIDVFRKIIDANEKDLVRVENYEVV